MAEIFRTGGGLFDDGDRIGEDVEGEALASRLEGGSLFGEEEDPPDDPDVQGLTARGGSLFSEEEDPPDDPDVQSLTARGGSLFAEEEGPPDEDEGEGALLTRSGFFGEEDEGGDPEPEGELRGLFEGGEDSFRLDTDDGSLGSLDAFEKGDLLADGPDGPEGVDLFD